MQTVRLALDAMATRFEIVLLGEDDTRLRAAGEEALREIEALDRRLSFYAASSELSDINRRAANESVVLAPDVFELIKLSLQLSESTGGAFDPTVGPLMRTWGFYRGKGSLPSKEAIATARKITGAHHVHLEESKRSVRFDTPGIEIDLGGIAKGYALDEAAAILRTHGVENSLLHGGTSTVIGIGHSYNDLAWRVGISDQELILGTVELTNLTMSVSAVSGKAFTRQETVYGHVIDPRSGWPTSGTAVAAVVSPRATVSDALSTAALVLGPEASSLLNKNTGIAVWSESRIDALIFEGELPAFSKNTDLVFPVKDYENSKTLPQYRK